MISFYREPEKRKELPPLDDAIDCIEINCNDFDDIFFIVPCIIFMICLHCLWSKDYVLYMYLTDTWPGLFIYALLFILIVTPFALLEAFLGRKERGCIAVYPEMMVIYLYDKEEEDIIAVACSAWEDVVKYYKYSPVIWFDSVDKDPWISNFKMKKLRPYLEQYAPHAQVIKFHIIDQYKYDTKKEKEREKQRKAEKWKEKDIKIWERKRAKMAAKEEKQKEKMAASTEITPEQKSEPREIDIHRE